MSRNAEKTEYLQEHLSYELLMLRHTLTEITKPHRILDWNAFLESFAVHARNLYDFLTNSDDCRNFKAQDFINGFKAAKDDNTISMFLRLHSQVFHLGKSRPIEQAEKANVDHAKQVIAWIEKNFTTFISGLAIEYDSKWNSDNADPSKVMSSAKQQSTTSRRLPGFFDSTPRHWHYGR